MSTHTIQLDDDAFQLLAKRTLGLNRTPSDVIRELLSGEPSNGQATTMTSDGPAQSALVTFVQSPQFRSATRAVDRYVTLFGWLYKNHTSTFSEIEQLPIGGRKHFAHTKGEIEGGAHSGTGAKRIPNSNLWMLTTLSNDYKKSVLKRVLQFLGYNKAEVALTLEEFPASKSRS